MRTYSRRMVRRGSPFSKRPVNSFKQVQYNAPASIAAGTQQNLAMVVGVDNYTGPSVNNYEVPTGATIKAIHVDAVFANSVLVNTVSHVAIQIKRSGQSAITIPAIGGNAQRNQVFRLYMKPVQQSQNTEYHFTFVIPPRFRRVREGDQWILSMVADAITVQSSLIRYKFYR